MTEDQDRYEEATDIQFRELKARIRMYHELYQKNQDRYKKLTGREYLINLTD